MKLYSTATSPYGRITKIVVHELGLSDSVEIVPAKTRTEGSPYYSTNFTGRVPYLVLADNTGIEDSQEICTYLDDLVAQSQGTSALAFTWPQTDDKDWQSRQTHRHAESLIDGLSVWLREVRRDPGEQSPSIIAHEKVRALRQLDWWENNIAHPRLRGDINLTQVILYCALDLDQRLADFNWRNASDSYPALQAFMSALSNRPSIQVTHY